jgi:hypothetical protein
VPRTLTRHCCNTHRRAARLPSVDGMLPDSWLLYNLKELHYSATQHTSTAQRQHTSPSQTRSVTHSNAIRGSNPKSQHHAPCQRKRAAQHRRRRAQWQPLHAQHTAQHDTHRAPHTAPIETHTQPHVGVSRHTHCRAARLPSVDGMLPDSWLSDKCKYLQDTSTAIASHHGPRHCSRGQPVPSTSSHINQINKE